MQGARGLEGPEAGVRRLAAIAPRPGCDLQRSCTDTRPQVPPSEMIWTQTSALVLAPGMVPWSLGNSGYLLIGNARRAWVFQFGRRGFDLGGTRGMSNSTALISLIFNYTPDSRWSAWGRIWESGNGEGQGQRLHAKGRRRSPVSWDDILSRCLERSRRQLLRVAARSSPFGQAERGSIEGQHPQIRVLFPVRGEPVGPQSRWPALTPRSSLPARRTLGIPRVKGIVDTQRDQLSK